LTNGRDDGIDNDNDWLVVSDDIGVDGVPNTEDQVRGMGTRCRYTQGRRTLDPLHPGEPNFELTDLDESDQIG
jgi:hypothetical protein